MDAFPAFFPLRGARVVIAGEGEAAEAKARLFDGLAGARSCASTGRGPLDAAAYDGADLVFVASFDAAFRAPPRPRPRGAGAPVNVVDHPALSDFHTPAIIDRGAGGRRRRHRRRRAAAGLAAARRNGGAHCPGAGALAALFGARREAMREAFPDLARRRAFLRGVLVGPAATRRRPAIRSRAASRSTRRSRRGGVAGADQLDRSAGRARPDLRCARRVCWPWPTSSCSATRPRPCSPTTAAATPSGWRIDAAAAPISGARQATRAVIVAIVGMARRSTRLIAALRARGVAVEALASARAS